MILTLTRKTSRTPRFMRSMTIFCMGARRKSEHSSYVFLRELEICVILEHIYIICVMLECMYIYIYLLPKPRSCLESTMWARFLFWIHRYTCFPGQLPCKCLWVIKLRSWSFLKIEGSVTCLTDDRCDVILIYEGLYKSCSYLCRVHGEGSVDSKRWRLSSRFG